MPVYSVRTPEGRTLDIEAPDEATAIRGAQNWSLQNKSKGGNPVTRAFEGQGPLAQLGSFAGGAVEQIPFLDEAAAGVTALTTGRPYERVREIQKELAAEDRGERGGARDAGGVAGFTATLAAPGGGYIKGAKTFGQGVSRAAQVGAAYGGLTAAGGADGGLQDRALAGAGGATLGAATGAAMPFIGRAVGKAITREAPVPKVEQLEAAKKAAYGKVRLLGGEYTEQGKKALLTQITQDLAADGLDAGAHPGAAAALKYAQQVLNRKGGLTLEDLDKIRQVAWRDAAGKKGPDAAAEQYFGNKLIGYIDEFVDTVSPTMTRQGDPRQLASAIKEARQANAVWRKFQRVDNEITSAELRSKATYGGDADRKLRERARPLIDPTTPGRNMRGATPDEKAAVERVAGGTPGQNFARGVAGAFDPRRLGGKILGPITGTGGVVGAPATAGLSLLAPFAQLGVGMGATKVSNDMARKNAENLLRIIASGGKKQPTPRLPTKAAAPVKAAVQKGRRAPGIAGALMEALAQGVF